MCMERSSQQRMLLRIPTPHLQRDHVCALQPVEERSEAAARADGGQAVDVPRHDAQRLRRAGAPGRRWCACGHRKAACCARRAARCLAGPATGPLYGRPCSPGTVAVSLPTSWRRAAARRASPSLGDLGCEAAAPQLHMYVEYREKHCGKAPSRGKSAAAQEGGKSTFSSLRRSLPAFAALGHLYSYD